jgi:hypothetical protein
VGAPETGMDVVGGAGADFAKDNKITFDDDWITRPAESLGGPPLIFTDPVPATDYAEFPVPPAGLEGPYQPGPDTAASAATLSAFDGTSAEGDWTIYVGDSGPLLDGTLWGWQLRITTVPEPASGVLAVIGASLVMVRPRRSRRSAA